MTLDVHPFPSDSPGALWLQAVAWVVVVVACAVAVRRPWAWPGLLGGLLGAAAAVTVLVDDLQLRAAYPDGLGAFVYDTSQEVDWPGFIVDRGLQAELQWAQSVALVLLAVAAVVGAVLSRRGRRRAG